jgi:hypothetical protein
MNFEAVSAAGRRAASCAAVGVVFEERDSAVFAAAESKTLSESVFDTASFEAGVLLALAAGILRVRPSTFCFNHSVD